MDRKNKTAFGGITGCVLLFALASVPARLSSIRFFNIDTPISISLKKESPSYLAFKMLGTSMQNEISLASSNEELSAKRIVLETHEESINFDNATTRTTVSATNVQKRVQVEKIYSKKFVLEEVKIEKAAQDFKNLVNEQQENEQLLNSLSAKQRIRVEKAQAESKILDQNWNEPVSFTEEAKEALKSTYQASTSPSGANSAGSDQPTIAQASPDQNEGDSSRLGFKVWGQLEITGGLAITNEHHLEIRRLHEGIPQEIGSVDLKQGHYSIEVPELVGVVTAKLVDKSGHVLGDASMRLTSLPATRTKTAMLVNAPKLSVAPRPEISGMAPTIYSLDGKPKSPAGAVINFLKGAEEQKLSSDASFRLSSVSKGSSTVARAAAENYLETTLLMTSGHEGKIPLFPNTMIAALREIVSSQRQMSLDSRLGTVIWGAVKMDDKPVRGLTVKLESQSDAKVVYLNEMMLPDPSLQSTSANGLYVFLNVEEGFHAVSAYRGDAYFGHANVLVEQQAVAIGDIESSTRSEVASIKVFDAFSGQPVPAKISMQGKGEVIMANDGSALVSLPVISRLSMMNIETVPTYFQANYFYNDADAYIHVPLVQQSWVMGIKTARGIPDIPDGGLIVGFVPTAEYEVYLAAEEGYQKNNIVYFDYAGRPTAKGQPGGGFILFNVRPDTHEVVVVDKTDRLQSQVVPVDPRAISVLRFNME